MVMNLMKSYSLTMIPLQRTKFDNEKSKRTTYGNGSLERTKNEIISCLQLPSQGTIAQFPQFSSKLVVLCSVVLEGEGELPALLLPESFLVSFSSSSTPPSIYVAVQRQRSAPRVLVTGCRARMYTTFTVLSGLGKVRSDNSLLPDSDHPYCSGPLLDLFQISMCGREQALLEGWPEPQFSSENYMAHTTIYNMCTQKPPHDYSQQLYNMYKEAFEEYIIETVLPSLREKHDEFMFSELEQRWINYKIMVRWLSRFFHYLDRCFISRRSLPALKDVGLAFF